MQCNFPSVARVDHTAWTPTTHPDSIVLFAGDGAVEEKTAEILPGILCKRSRVSKMPPFIRSKTT